jgi:hypothetical protein
MPEKQRLRAAVLLPVGWHRKCFSLAPLTHVMNHDAAIQEIARGVACYLCQNPNACDEAQGIARWWLAAGHTYSDVQIELALSWLVRWGLVGAVHAADGRVRYAARERQLDDLKALCETGNAPGTPHRPAGHDMHC